MNAKREINILVKHSQDGSSWSGEFRQGSPVDPETPQWVIDQRDKWKAFDDSQSGVGDSASAGADQNQQWVSDIDNKWKSIASGEGGTGPAQGQNQTPTQVGGFLNGDVASRISTNPPPQVGGLINWDVANRVSTKPAPAVGGLLRPGATASPPKKTPQVGGFLKSRRTAAPNKPQVGGLLKHSEANAKEEINALVKRAGIVQDAVVGTLTPLYAWQNRRWRKAHGLPEVPFSGATKYNSVLGAAQSAVNASGVPVGKPYRPSVWHGGKQVTQ